MTNGKDQIFELPAEIGNHEVICNLNGLTKREYFAGLAMQGLTAAGYSECRSTHLPRIAELATEQADALIEALNK